MLLFDPANRTHSGPAKHVEDSYSFLCRSAWDASARARHLLEDWFSHYPIVERRDLRHRFVSSFDVAFFELALHELLRRSGARVSVHPEVPEARTRPDYLAKFPDGTEVLVEAVVATDQSATASAEQARQHQLWDGITKLNSPNFFLQITTYEVLTDRQPSGRRIRAFLDRELSRFDPDEVAADFESGGFDALPTLNYEDLQVRIDFTLIPKANEGRTKASRPIGIYPTVFRWGGTTAAIRNAVNRKATRYGSLRRSFVVAVNCTSPWGFGNEDVVDALFGTECVVSAELEREPSPQREPDGVWHGPQGARNTRVSAVLFSDLDLWGLHTSAFRLFLNPWATVSLDTSHWKVPLARPVNGGLDLQDGVSPSKIYDLPEDWPGQRRPQPYTEP